MEEQEFPKTQYRFCPNFGQKCKYFEVPFCHTDPLEGLMIYGPFSTPKTIICPTGNDGYFHFRLDATDEHRLVKLSCYPEQEQPDNFDDLPF